MKKTLTFLFCSGFLFAHAQKLEQVWKSDAVWKVPESVYFHNVKNVLYVSNIGEGEAKGKGSIGKVKPDGTGAVVEWVKGLDGPKGMAVVGNNLWVADLTNMRVIGLNQARIQETIAVEGAVFLNDVASGPGGTVYVSDSRSKKVHEIKGKKVTTLIEGLEGPNGLLWQKEGLYILDNGKLLLRQDDGTVKTIATGMEGGTDGVERVNEKDFIISSWAGVIYFVTESGVVTKLLDSREEKINTADIGYDDATKMLYVPGFYKNTVTAYKLVL